MYFFEIIEEEGKQSSAIKVDELKLNASFLNSKKTQEQETAAEPEGENFFYYHSFPVYFNLQLKMSQNLIKHISTNFFNFGTKSHQSHYLF